ncbi:outer membrane lipoprotein, partial [Candidatus Gastranaerophilus sp. (ex Termes propinquus)]
RVGEKNVTGNFWVREAYITRVLSGCKNLALGSVFNVKQLQGVAKTINREPYMKTILAISKNEEEETVIDFDIQDRFPLRAHFAWDDFGRDLIGRQRVSMLLGSYNLTGFGDSIYAGPILADRSQAVVAGYQVPILPCLTTLGFEYSGVKVKPGGEFEELGIEGVSRFFTLIAKHTLINNVSTDLISYAAFDWIDTNTQIEAIEEPIVNYVLRVPRVGLNLVHDDTTGRWISNAEASFGINGLGASDNVPGGPQTGFQKFTGSLVRVQRLPRDLLGVVRVNGQYSPQAIEDGVVKIVINESRVGEKNVTGNFWVREAYITRVLSGCKNLALGSVFNVKQLQGV